MYYLFSSPIPGKAYDELSEEEKTNFEIDALNLEFDIIILSKLIIIIIVNIKMEMTKMWMNILLKK